MAKKPLQISPYSLMFQPDPQSPLTKPYNLFYEYLRISPTYELARQASEEGLPDQALREYPKDFRQVLKTYQLLGNVRDVPFHEWYARCRSTVFGEDFDRPISRVISGIKDGELGNPEVIGQGIDHYLNNFRGNEGNAPVLIAAIPLNTSWSEVSLHLRQYWGIYGIGVDHIKPGDAAKKSKISFAGERIRTDGLKKGLGLVKVRAANPKEALWRVGLMAEVSEPYNNSPELSLASGRKVATEQEDDERRLLTRITSRILLRAQTVAENVARGRFPCYKPVEKLPFDWERIVKLFDYTPDPFDELFESQRKEAKSTNAKIVRRIRTKNLSQGRK